MSEPDGLDRQQAEYGLVIAFTVCESKGGPYEDNAFVAGYIAGMVHQRLSRNDWPKDYVANAPTPLVPQLDLIAMNYGYKTWSNVDADHPEWAHVAFEKEH